MSSVSGQREAERRVRCEVREQRREFLLAYGEMHYNIIVIVAVFIKYAGRNSSVRYHNFALHKSKGRFN